MSVKSDSCGKGAPFHRPSDFRCHLLPIEALLFPNVPAMLSGVRRSFAMVGGVEQPLAKYFRHDDRKILLFIRRHPTEHSDFDLNESAGPAIFPRENLFSEGIDS